MKTVDETQELTVIGETMGGNENQSLEEEISDLMVDNEEEEEEEEEE